jgi:hypothetical protein
MAYTGIDRATARLRLRAAYRHIRPGSHACDLGAASRRLFWITRGRIARFWCSSLTASITTCIASVFVQQRFIGLGV